MTTTGVVETNAVDAWLARSLDDFTNHVHHHIDYYRGVAVRQAGGAPVEDEAIVQGQIASLRSFCEKSVNVAANTDHLIPYLDPRVQYMNSPEFRQFGAAWSSPQAQWHGVTRVYPTPSFIDYLLDQYRALLEHGYDGVYLDDMYVLPGNNPDAGSAVRDADGVVHPRMGILATRELVKRLAVLQHEMGRSPRMTVVHMTNALLTVKSSGIR